MINQNFIDESEKIRKTVKDRALKFYNGNVLIQKVKVDRLTAGGIFIDDNYADREEFKSGFAKILALPEDYDGPLKEGDYCIFSHDLRYKLYPAAIREMLDFQVGENNLYTIQDNNVILTRKRETFEKDAEKAPS